ncbi:Ankyrin repeat protein [Penicillium sp. IBT 18751x]|nr:Ankyrin repeat protein [Penicillium sp. IBT 18751x]
MCGSTVNSSFLDGGEPHNTIFPPAYLTASCTLLRTMTSNNALDSSDSHAIVWIAALPIERAAAEAMLDEEHAAPTGFTRYQIDANVYTWGRVGEHNIVIASLASGVQKAPGSIQF